MTTQGALLPFELQEDIIENLWNDYKSLSACSLVSSQWSERARRLLFSNVTASIFGDVTCVDDDVIASFMTFMELLEAPHSRLGRYIQRVYIQGPDDFQIIEAYRALPEKYSYFISVLQMILPCLTHVSEITMATITWNMIPDDVKIQLENFTKVNTLSWLRVHFDRLDQLLLFSADTFPQLQTLRIEDLDVKAAPPSYQSLFSSYPNQFASLRALSLYVEESTVPLLSALSSNVIVPVQNIDTLDLEISCWATIGYLDSILRATGPTLRVLKLQIDIYGSFLDDPGFELVPSLRQMVNLKSLHFVRWPNMRDLIWIRNILRTMSCVTYSLEEIHLSFSRDDIDFLLLERAILEQKIQNFKVIIERVEWAHKKYELLDILKQSFPELSRRGRIRFVGWD